MPTKILFVFGTRPEAIKLAPLILMTKKDPRFDVLIAVTAQHREMLDQVLKVFAIRPDFDLNLMSKNQSLNQIVSRSVLELDKVFAKSKPDWVIVHGDTSTTLASSLAAFHQQIKVAHIEAGLRSFDLTSPFPEEMNRQVVSRLATLHCAPTQAAKSHLRKEGVPLRQIIVSGNTVIDALLEIVRKIKADASMRANFERLFPFLDRKKKLILVTTHRRENLGQGLLGICEAIKKLAKERKDLQFVIPLHLNPQVKNLINEKLAQVERVYLIEPQDYLPFVYLMMRSHMIFTDSGGIQEEASSLAKPVLILRKNTERPEAIKAGSAVLVGTSSSKICTAAQRILDNKSIYKKMCDAKSPFGDGQASQRIIPYLL